MNKFIQSFRHVRLQAGLTFFAIAICSFNSQEHKIIADVGISRVTIPEGFPFPQGTGFITDFDYANGWKSAKSLAVGFETNNDNDYDKWKKKVQDNCYWTNFAQLDYNKKNWIEASKHYPDRLFQLPAYVGTTKYAFSFGDLVALYGDYRRTVYAENGDCYLTDPANKNISFSGKYVTSGGYCPDDMPTADYLHAIAYGLLPPFGTLGNVSKNTAGDREFKNAGWWGDEMMRLASGNETHFSNAAVAWYTGMHRLALLYAQKAVAQPQYWNQALHYEASALHSLTDLFAFGHVVSNCDKRSNAVMRDNNLTNKTSYKWMQNVIRMGGGDRAGDGTIAIAGTSFPAIADLPNVRDDFMPSYVSNTPSATLGSGYMTSLWGVIEHKFHDYFNETEVRPTVRNFNGDRFKIYGDGQLYRSETPDRKIVEDAVTASVQSLVDAFMMLQKGTSVEEIGKLGSDYFKALKYIPVFIESDHDNYFTGTWAMYAGSVRSITGMSPMKAGWLNCRIPILSGEQGTLIAPNWPKAKTSACTTF